MIADWLDLTLEGHASARGMGRIPGGRYEIVAPGVLEITPDVTGPRARPCVISAGIHGNETAPIELLGELIAGLESGHLIVGAPLLLILGNLPAIRSGERFITTNLNRLFKRAEASVTGNDCPSDDEPARARQLMAAVDTFYARFPLAEGTRRLHYDMHTAIRDSLYPRFAVVPFSDGDAISASQWPILSAAGIQAVLHQHQHSWTFSHYSRHYHDADAFTLELGQVRPFGANDMAALAPMKALLAALATGTAPAEADPEAIDYFTVEVELMRQSADFTLCFSEDVANFTAFAPGSVVAEDAAAGSCIIGDTPLRVVFPNAKVEIGARAALLLAESSTPTD
ncbi:MAG: succinylglutamate desuccinylase [Cobetia sp.]|uniref:succinylglutamate desuccinylase n=2 Tax=Cobetia TaxID=204286 RepID=UPI000C5D6AB8|nr:MULTISPECIES: succinylglutamate desuccinylase [unclassified Cobetia]MBK10077.1 succinylglutamate desuccinylase [Cobetia sp.]BBO57584.1 succinylglutamate desuccinylase [Cobetia sp. AM6]HAR09850.1 succinylglutamate desuccinylase [Cobetia sp.]HBJ28470.1 succinylglutamate desuccinylase [Cobetia sp.]